MTNDNINSLHSLPCTKRAITPFAKAKRFKKHKPRFTKHDQYFQDMNKIMDQCNFHLCHYKRSTVLKKNLHLVNNAYVAIFQYMKESSILFCLVVIFVYYYCFKLFVTGWVKC